MSNIVPEKYGLRQIKRANLYDRIHHSGLGLQTNFQTIFRTDMYRIVGDGQILEIQISDILKTSEKDRAIADPVPII